jgi:sortase A
VSETTAAAATSPAPGSARPGRGARIADAVALTLRTTGELAMTFGVLILLFVVYELYFTGIATEHAQDNLQKQFTAARSAGVTPSTAPALGAGIAEMYAPALGSRTGWHFIVVEGTGESQLAKGPGHFEYPPDLARELGISKPIADGSTPSAFPGQVGNVVISGHRTTHAHPFFNANRFAPGDAVILETSTTWYVYAVTSTESVLPTDVAVTFPVPDHPGVKPTQQLLTLTTCNPRYSASHRLVIHAVLAYSQPLSAGDPAAFATGKA